MSEVKVLNFGLGEVVTNWGTFGGLPAVFIEPADPAGIVGLREHPEGEVDIDTLRPGCVVLQIHHAAGIRVLLEDIDSALAGKCDRPSRLVEMSFAYERASGLIKAHCVMEDHTDELENGWYDLSSSEVDLTDEVAYLESRRLIHRHPQHPAWVTIADEGEPYPEAAHG